MAKRICTDTRKVSDQGDSSRITIPKQWLEILGFDENGEVETSVLHTEKYGFFFGAWVEGEQPDFEDVSVEDLKQIADEGALPDGES